ncbi:hypothetical protein E2I00_018467, partial [Balaenoptera physalus]
AKRCDKKSLLTIRTECKSCSLNFGMKCPDGYTKITNGTIGIRDCRSEHTRCLSLDAAISVGRTISSLSAVQATGAQTAWTNIWPNGLLNGYLGLKKHFQNIDFLTTTLKYSNETIKRLKSAREERGRPAVAGAVVLTAWKETEAAPAKKDLAEQPVKPALMTTYLDPAVQQDTFLTVTGGPAVRVRGSRKLPVPDQLIQYMGCAERQDLGRDSCLEGKLSDKDGPCMCSCVHGVCNSGIRGDGTCECYSGYTGPNCDKPIPECAALLCPENSRCSPSSEDETKLACKCIPSYQGDGKHCEPINPCSQNICHPHARCTYLGPNQHSCTCQEGYHGDGQVCLPVDPCQVNFGNCPTESTVCRYDGPGQAHCECAEHYRNFVPGVGCSMTDVCESKNPCHRDANCTTIMPGHTKCTCRKGYVGDGSTCYGNIMERLRELNTEPRGKWQGRLTSFISLLDKVYAWPLSNLGPFTVLLPTDKGLKGFNVKELLLPNEAAQYFVKLHIIAGQMSTEQMNNTHTFYTLTGKAGGLFTGDKDSHLKLKLYGGKKKVKIIEGNIIASNGLLHILDRAMDKVTPTFESNTEETSVGHVLDEDGIGGPYTVFVPSDEALNNMKDGTLDYLLSSEGSRKLLELVRYHIVPFTQLEVAALISTPHIRSMANQIIRFNTTDNTLFIRKCVYTGRIRSLKNGCARYCNATVKELARCLGFHKATHILFLRYQSAAMASTGPTATSVQEASRIRAPGMGRGPKESFQAELNLSQRSRPGNESIWDSLPGACCPDGQGPCLCLQCADGLDGNGTCVCQDGFQGSQCQFCSDPNKYGPRCEKSKCRFLSCRVLLTRGPCSTAVQSWYQVALGLVDALITGVSVQFRNVCVCKAGYEGDGSLCSEMDPCSGLTRGGCSRNAECIKTGRGTHICVCHQGWTGDGRDCSEINTCLLPSAGGCHHNATCLYVGPGQNECECKKGFRGNGIDCEPVTSCLEQTGKCHPLPNQALTFHTQPVSLLLLVSGVVFAKRATKEMAFSAMETLQWAGWPCSYNINSDLDGFEVVVSFKVSGITPLPRIEKIIQAIKHERNAWLWQHGDSSSLGIIHVGIDKAGKDDAQSCPNASLQPMLSAASNLTVLVPSQQAIEDMDQDEKAFWLTKSNIPTLIKYHTLLGTYGVADLQALSPSDMLATSLQGNFLHLAKADGNITIEGASVIDGDNAATNGVIHIINKVQNRLLPHMLNLSSFYAIQQYSKEEDVLKYHVVLEEKLLKNDLHNGMHRETMLGFSYLLGFFLRNDQLYVNEAPINYTNVATDKGVIHGLGKVLEIQKNRCDINDTTILRGAETKKCLYTIYFMGKRSLFIGCQPKCVKTVITRECCAGYFGPQCQPCPGKAENVCFGNGICLDGVNGTGTCVCGEGFSGTACETCTEGKYGIHCDQACTCVHGRCNQGPAGDGSCNCDVGWRGVKCDDEITKDECNGTCHTTASSIQTAPPHANAQQGSKGTEQSAQATINACEISNGGCSGRAVCKRTTPGSRVCVCKAGYTGDGIVCIEINPCLENHGGCHEHAECTQTGPNQKNGGCSEFAICNHTGEDERTCTCKPNYIGDGFTCRGNIHQELPKNPKTSQYYFQLLEHSVRDLVGPGPFTVLAPLSAAFDEEPQIKDWDKQGLMPQVLRYHVIACHQLLLENLKLTPNATSLQGESIVISVSQDTVLINNKAKIISSDIISTNGIIHIIDKLLSPHNLLITPKDASGRILQNLTTVAINHGYIKFSNLIQDSGLLSVITDPIHTPVTLFWPSDQALQALPPEQQEFLFNQDNKDKLKEYLKFHVIRDSKVLAVDLPRSATWKTLQGSELSVKCGAGSDIGELFLNGQMCRIVQRELFFDLGVAYGIDCLLIDPTLGGRCDTFTTFDVSGEKRKCLYDLPFRRNLEGCKQQCTLVIQLPKCCKGYFWPDCQACPGGPDTPCNNRGVCLDQYSPAGQCKCNTGFNGTACELCWPGRFGPDCQPCGCSDHGQCNDGITGSGQCICETGWTGRFCDTQTVLPLVCMPPCSAHATCKENNTCECNLNYEGDGITCTVVDFCKQNNGGCAKVAKCSQKDTKVSCSCQKGYQGDGHSCTEIDPCADGLNGGCHEHATCQMTGPVSLASPGKLGGKHRCECKRHYVGDGLDYTTVGVFHLRSPLGQYKLTFDKAREACTKEAATMATYNQLSYAQKAKYHLCSAGWLDSGRVAYPTSYSSQNCGSGIVGIVDYGTRNNKSEMWDVFCYRMKDVNCTCKVGYVGDGFSCSGNLLQVLMSFPSLTNFLTEVLAYSNSSARGRAFLKHLTDLSIRSTLFVPQNSGLGENETLSGRDIEHHLANVSIFFYNDLVNGTILHTRLGSQLLITSSQDQRQPETRFIDGRAILQWDIFASNGIIHVISRPLKAPPTPVTSSHAGLGTGMFFAIVLVTGAIALAAYSYFRLNQRTIGFQHFEQSEEDIDVAALGKQQPENISNPIRLISRTLKASSWTALTPWGRCEGRTCPSQTSPAATGAPGAASGRPSTVNPQPQLPVGN